MPCDSFDGGRRCLPNVAASVSRSTCDLGAASAAEERRIRRRSLGKSPASAPLRASGVDPLLTCNSAETTDKAYLQEFSSPLTDSNRRPPPLPSRVLGKRDATTGGWWQGIAGLLKRRRLPSFAGVCVRSAPQMLHTDLRPAPPLDHPSHREGVVCSARGLQVAPTAKPELPACSKVVRSKPVQ